MIEQHLHGPADPSGSPARRWGALHSSTAVLCFVVLTWAALLFVADVRDDTTPPWINHDVAFHSWLGMELLHGARLYVDFNDSNPPGSQFLHGGLVALTDLLSAPDFIVHHAFVLLLGAVGLLLLWRTFRSDATLTPVLVWLAYLVVIIRGNFSNTLFAAGHLPYDFGEREHLFSLLFLPWLIGRLRDGGRSPWMVPWLVLLGFVSMFKPYWALFVLVVECVIWSTRRRRELLVWSALAAGMVLPYAILLVHSVDSFRAFFGVLLPFELGGSYAHYEESYADFVASPYHTQLVLGGAVFAAAWIPCYLKRLLERWQLWLLLALPVGAYLSIVHQHKFWSYHGMVYFGLVLVGGALLFGRLADGLRSARAGRILGGGLAVVLVGVAGITLGSLCIMLTDYGPLGYEVVPLIEGRQRVMFFSMSVDYSYAPLHLRVPTVGPWSVHQDLPMILSDPDPVERQRKLDRYADQVSQRIDEARPELLIFAPYTQALPPGTTLHGVMADLGVVPRAGYRRMSELALLSLHPRLARWIVYEREAGP